MKVLILCTGNSCRSQMAHGFLKSFDKKITFNGITPSDNKLIIKSDIFFDENLNPYQAFSISLGSIVFFAVIVKYIEPLQSFWDKITGIFSFNKKTK